MTANVTGDFTTARGVADVDRVAEVERCDQLGEVIGIGVHVVAVPGLAGAPVASAIVGDTSVSAHRQKDHLVFPRIRA